MPKTASNFARTLESKLLPMVNKASGGAAGLQESIACLCAVVNNLTQSYERLVKLLGSCVGQCPPHSLSAESDVLLTIWASRFVFFVAGKLEHVRKNFEKTGHLPAEQKTIALLLCITGLLGEHCDFDDVSSTNGGESVSLHLRQTRAQADTLSSSSHVDRDPADHEGESSSKLSRVDLAPPS